MDRFWKIVPSIVYMPETSNKAIEIRFDFLKTLCNFNGLEPSNQVLKVSQNSYINVLIINLLGKDTKIPRKMHKYVRIGCILDLVTCFCLFMFLKVLFVCVYVLFGDVLTLLKGDVVSLNT